jgi:ABC-type uncharacterized transport system permease subunit
MSATTPGARRISEKASRAVATLSERRAHVEPIVDPVFTSVCAAVLLAALIMSALLAMRSGHPVPAYAIFGSGLFGAVFGSFLVAALHIALTDSRRHKDDD